MSEVPETEPPVSVGHRMESRRIRGLPLAQVKLLDMVLLDNGRKQGKLKKKIKFL